MFRDRCDDRERERERERERKREREKERQIKPKLQQIHDKRNVVNVKPSYHARMYTRIHSFVLRAYANHLLVS